MLSLAISSRVARPRQRRRIASTSGLRLGRYSAAKRHPPAGELHRREMPAEQDRTLTRGRGALQVLDALDAGQAQHAAVAGPAGQADLQQLQPEGGEVTPQQRAPRGIAAFRKAQPQVGGHHGTARRQRQADQVPEAMTEGSLQRIGQQHQQAQDAIPQPDGPEAGLPEVKQGLRGGFGGFHAARQHMLGGWWPLGKGQAPVRWARWQKPSPRRQRTHVMLADLKDPAGAGIRGLNYPVPPRLNKRCDSSGGKTS